MPNVKNYVLLETITVGAAGASSVTFNNIPQTGYTDLVIKMSARGSSNVDVINATFNGSTSSFSNRYVQGDGSAAASGSSTRFVGQVTGSSTTANTFANSEIYIPNYTSSANKSVSVDTVTEQNGTTAYTNLSATLWSVTSAITSITLTPGSGNFVQYSTFSLYGLAAVGTTPTIAPYAAGGDIIQTDGTYWYHAFLSSGTFTPAKGLSCNVLVVAGGGGGSGGNGYGGGAGGGAGGLLAFTSQSLSATGYTVTVGAGGAGTTGDGAGTTGNDSQFGALTLVKGGGGGGGKDLAGLTGGSGGGGGTGRKSGGSATSGQGYAGGSSSFVAGGGGGGAGAIGSNGTFNGSSGSGGNGGAGLNTYSSWLTATGLGVSGYIAGGGAGGSYDASSGTGGSGGGGNGGDGSSGTAGSNGSANTGGGAGGGGTTAGNATFAGGSGGSGIVIVRYAI